MPLTGALHESLRIYMVCKGMEWAHLPVAGGLYDQHPKFMDDMLIIMHAEGEYMREEQRKREHKNKPSMASSGSRRRR